MLLSQPQKLRLIPEKPTITEVTDLRITYIIPKNLYNSGGIDGLNFDNRYWGTDVRQEKIITNIKNNILIVERRVDNGVLGSGRIYKINVTKDTKLDNKIITLRAKSMSTYQEGLFLPFPLPDFDLKSYLTSASVNYDFELNSDFPVKSIKANFDRLFKSDIALSKALCLINVEVYPYRNGSKISVKANIYNMKLIDDVINVSQSIMELEKYIKSIVNS